jgi:hypothetical protein
MFLNDFLQFVQFVCLEASSMGSSQNFVRFDVNMRRLVPFVAEKNKAVRAYFEYSQHRSLNGLDSTMISFFSRWEVLPFS